MAADEACRQNLVDATAIEINDLETPALGIAGAPLSVATPQTARLRVENPIAAVAAAQGPARWGRL
jgi:hypothetical protein